MKKQIGTDFLKVMKQANELTAIVKETVAADFISVKSFTTVDLWNIRRQGKAAIARRKTATFH